MEKQIHEAAISYTDTYSDFSTVSVHNAARHGFKSGANWMLDQYNGVTPEQVKEITDALRALNDRLSFLDSGVRSGSASDRQIASAWTIVNNALSKLTK